ncbi:MAG: hypothetical protein H7249_14865 [Chitinophagaceae bacterium]|nr:hypothetical protein [Oligoflexus sp.]
MFIDGIKVIPEGGSEPRLWKFRNSQGAYKHLCVLACDEGDASLIKQAISYALFGTRAPRVKGVLLALTDDNGDAWIFERSAENFRCVKNRQLLDVRGDAPQKDLFADFMPLDNKASFSWMELTKAFELSTSGLDILGESDRDRSQRKSAWETLATDRSAAAKNSLEKAWGKTVDLDLITKLIPLGDAFTRRWFSIQEQTKGLSKIFDQVDQVDTGLMRRLEQELELIEQIRRIAEPLMGAAKSPKNWHEKMNQVEAEKLRLEDTIAAQAMPIPDDDVDWSYVLQVLSRSLACDRLEKTARAALQEAKDKISPIYRTHRASVVKFLEHDQELIRTLEACLHDLDASLHRSNENHRDRGNLAHKLNRLLGFNPAEPLKLKPQGEAEDGIDDARALVNQILHHIGHLYSQLDEQTSVHDEKLKDFETKYEQIASECAKSKEQWNALAQSLGLNTETSVSHLILSINLYSQLSALRHKSSRLQEEYGDYKNSVRTLVTLIESWRSHTGSQKSLSLDHPNVVLSEAKGIMSYADKKLAQVKKLRSIEAQIEAYRLMKSRIGQDCERIETKWKEALEELGLPHKELGADDLVKSFESGRELLQFESLRKQTQQALKNEQIFAETVFDAPLVFYTWGEPSVPNKVRLQFLQYLEQSKPHGWGLLLCQDQGLVEMMQKLGVSHGQKVASKPAEPKVSAPVSQKPLISDKARSALEIFASKQGGTPR